MCSKCVCLLACVLINYVYSHCVCSRRVFSLCAVFSAHLCIAAFQMSFDTQVRCDTKLSTINLYGAPVKDVISFLRTSRRRVIHSAGGMGLADDLSNLDATARQMGWKDVWYVEKKPRGAPKAAQPPQPSVFCIL